MKQPICRRASLSLETLEDRQVPALAAFNAATGQLTVNLQEADNNASPPPPTHNIPADFSVNAVVALTAVGNVRIAGKAGALPTNQVRAITVLGSDRADRVYLHTVTSQAFSGLDGRIRVEGRGGDDV